MPRVVILGAGFAGCTVADLLKRRPGYSVTVLEGAPVPGGGCWTRRWSGHPYTFGPRIFYTPDKEVFAQMTKHVELRHFYTKTWTFADSDHQLYHYPILASDLEKMPDQEQIREELKDNDHKEHPKENFESYWKSAIGLTLYNKFMDQYSRKMWGIHSNKELVTEFRWVNKGTPIRWDNDDRLYKDQMQGYPVSLDGYNSYFLKCLEGTEVFFNTFVDRFSIEKNAVMTAKGEVTGDVFINTLHIDQVLGFEYGKLRYFGREFVPLILPVEYAMPEDCTWVHYSQGEKYTRVVEFKKITNYQSPFTLLGIEFPMEGKGRYYPVPTPPELKRYEQYQAMYPKNFHSIGRLGTFKYKGIEDAIRDALDVCEKI